MPAHADRTPAHQANFDLHVHWRLPHCGLLQSVTRRRGNGALLVHELKAEEGSTAAGLPVALGLGQVERRPGREGSGAGERGRVRSRRDDNSTHEGYFRKGNDDYHHGNVSFILLVLVAHVSLVHPTHATVSFLTLSLSSPLSTPVEARDRSSTGCTCELTSIVVVVTRHNY